MFDVLLIIIIFLYLYGTAVATTLSRHYLRKRFKDYSEPWIIEFIICGFVHPLNYLILKFYDKDK